MITLGGGMVMASSSRHRMRVAAGCLAAAGLLAGSANPGSEGMPSFRLAGNPEGLVRAVSPGPGKAALKAAATLVQERAAALARSRQRVTAVSLALTRLQTQAEMVTERYDLAVATEQQAAAAYQAAVARLAVARRTQAGSRSRVAGQAAADFEAQGALGPMAVMFGGT